MEAVEQVDGEFAVDCLRRRQSGAAEVLEMGLSLCCFQFAEEQAVDEATPGRLDRAPKKASCSLQKLACRSLPSLNRHQQTEISTSKKYLLAVPMRLVAPAPQPQQELSA